MDDDTERGIIFFLGLVAGLAVMWLVFTARGRSTAQQVFVAAEELAAELGDQAGDLLKAK